VEFPPDRSKASGRRSACRECESARSRGRDRARERASDRRRSPASAVSSRPKALDCEGGCGTSIEQNPSGTKLQRWCRPCRGARYAERYRKSSPCRGCGQAGSWGRRLRCAPCLEARSAPRPSARTRREYPSYCDLHKRLRSQRGRASTMSCMDCGSGASEWAYNHSGVDEHEEYRNDKMYRYSTDISQYDPLCRQCHNVRDGRQWTKDRYEHSPLKKANDTRVRKQAIEHARVSNW
jgi:hypothetical protein